MKYQILNTLHKDEYQCVYVVKNTIFEDSSSLIMNEIIDGDMIYAIKDSFTFNNIQNMSNIVETFYDNSKFYIISNICMGDSFETFLKNNSLRMVEKLRLCEELLCRIAELKHFIPLIQYNLCDYNNISIYGKKHICFNSIFVFDKNHLNITMGEVISQIGSIIRSIFCNSADNSDSLVRDDIPPAISDILGKCANKEYNEINEILNDFRSTLLYSTFMGNKSLDTQIMSNMKRVRKKQESAPFIKFAFIALFTAVVAFGGVYSYMRFNMAEKNKIPASADVHTTGPNNKENDKPVAKFTPSVDKIYVGEEVSFLDQSYDSNLNGSISDYSWILSKDDSILLKSNEDTLKYLFTSEGNYLLDLTVKNSIGNESDEYSYSFNVFPKSQIPEQNNNDKNSENVDFK